MSKNSFDEHLNVLFPPTETHIERIPFPKEEVVILIDQLVRLQSIKLADNECNSEIVEAMKTLNDGLALLIKSPRLIIGNQK
jgi:hypothetical protein